MPNTTDIVVVGGGVAGLGVALELQRLGMQTMRDVVVLDAESGPGGSWRRAWDALPMRMARDLVEPEGLDDFDLGFARVPADAPVREIVPQALSYFEDASNLYVFRPARVQRVTSPRGSSLLHVDYRGPSGRLATITCRILIDATGHWSSPFVPWVPGMRGFTGRHLPAARLERLDELQGARALIVGGGRTAADLLQLLEGRAASLTWSTRREPEFRAHVPRASASPVAGPHTELSHADPTNPDLPSTGDHVHPGWSVSRPTPDRTVWPGRPGGLRQDWGVVRPEGDRPWADRGEIQRPVGDRAWIPRTAQVASAIERGLLVSAGPIERFEGARVHFTDGRIAEFDAVVWATGSHAPRRHLAPLRLRESSAFVRPRSGWTLRDRRVAMVGDGTDVSSEDALAHAIEVAAQAVDSLDDLGMPSGRR